MRIGVVTAASAGLLAAIGVGSLTSVHGASASLSSNPMPGASVAVAMPAAEITPAAANLDPTPVPPVSSAPVPSPPPTTPTPPPDPLAGLSKKTTKAFRPCLETKVGPKASGKCAKLVLSSLKKAGFYPWYNGGRMNVAAVNALLNYQRSRGLKATGHTNTDTWVALAAKTPKLPVDLPEKCTGKGIVLCVDQAHRRLFWLSDGKVKKTFTVRLGGYNSHPKTGKWRNFPTANGTWKVYDKQVDPKSENYGSGAMPYSVMFYPDMYVHYSPGFASVGYAGSSHGCVNIGKLSEARWIFAHTPIGAKVHIFSPTAAS